MKSAFAIALAIGVATAASLQKPVVSDELDISDTSFIEALASKYDCREAGASLEKTIAKVKSKNAAEQAALGTECTKRRKDYNSPWRAARSAYSTAFPKVVPEEMTTYRGKTNRAKRALAAVKAAQARAVARATATAQKAQRDFTAKDSVFNTARGEMQGARRSYAAQKKKFTQDTKPKGHARNKRVYLAAKALTDRQLKSKMSAARSTRSKANYLCESITAARKKHVDADNKLLQKEIAPLIKELSELKCVDSYDKQRKASGLDSLIEVDLETKAKCALASSKAASFLETTHFLSALPLDAQFKTFTDRVEEERTHMANVHSKCLGAATRIYSGEKNRAENAHSTESTRNLDAKTKADQALDDALENLIKTNRRIIAEKVQAMVEPRANREAASKALIAAKTGLDSAQNTRRSEEAVAVTQHKNAMDEALKTKNNNINSRKNTLNAIKDTAERKYKEDKKFVEEYCASSERDLKKEKRIVDKIAAKLAGLKVVDTAVVGKKAEDKVESDKKKAEQSAKRAVKRKRLKQKAKARQRAARKKAEQQGKARARARRNVRRRRSRRRRSRRRRSRRRRRWRL